MVFIYKALFILSAITFNLFIFNASASEQINFFICSANENKSQYAVIERETIDKKIFNDDFDNNWSVINQLAPFFLVRGHYIPSSCEIVNLKNLTNEFPYLKDSIKRYLTLEDSKDNKEPLIVVLPTQLTNSDSINKVRPAIIATSLTFAILWGLGSSYLAPGCLMVFITCAFRPEQCQTVLENFSDFFSELWTKATSRQSTSMSGTGHRLGN
ncbi:MULTISPECIES: hypothetical protein [unclassified Endozoicomonas]|uniref:hypothetical protein n=1 Tax=unclassified Endozoicomonas TaxID=2644528 RepID=UPI002148237F|nr:MULTISPECIES: hypothetical protein [unclassified Endozoicomonas]